MPNRLNICLLMMSADPRHGSEPGRTICMALNIISDPRISHATIIFPEWNGNVPIVEKYLERHKHKTRIISLPFWSNVKISHSFPLKYLTYTLYNREASRLALRQDQIDVYHQLNFAGFRFGMPILSQRPNTVWGPISGTEQFPLGAAWRYLSLSGKAYYLFYNVMNKLQFSLASRRNSPIKKTALIFAATSIDRQNIQPINSECYHLPETGTEQTFDNEANFKGIEDRVKIIWSGALIDRKGFPLLLASLEHVDFGQTGAIDIHIYGKGPKAVSWQRKAAVTAEKLHNRVRFVWHGEVPRNEFLDQVKAADLLAATTFREANSNVIAEAISRGVPVVGLAVSGLRDTLVNQPNKLIELSSKNLALSFGHALEELIVALKRNQVSFALPPVLKDNDEQARTIVDSYVKVVGDARACLV